MNGNLIAEALAHKLSVSGPFGRNEVLAEYSPDCNWGGGVNFLIPLFYQAFQFIIPPPYLRFWENFFWGFPKLSQFF